MWVLDKKNPIPLYRQIMEQIITYIQEGKLLPGEKLPPERKLAVSYGVNRSTIVRALDELVSLGWIVRKQGSGTIVNEGRWGRATEPRVDWRRHLLNSYSTKDSYVTAIEAKRKDGQVLDLYSGDLPISLIPSFEVPSFTWEELIIEERQQNLLGYPPLQKAISQRLSKDYQIDVSSKEVLITSGAQQALFLILQVMLQTGDSVAIENPSFLYSLPIFETAGVRLYGAEMDDEGICIEDLKQLILKKKIKLLLLNPTFQNPTGKVMSLKRRKEVIRLCSQYQIPIVEDDVFSELNFSESIPTMKSLAPHQVIYIGSLSKIFSSSIKIGWIVADRELVQILAKARQMMDFSLSVFPQILASNALVDTNFDSKQHQLVKNVQQKAVNFEKHAAILKENWQVEPIKGGLYCWMKWRGPRLNRLDWQKFLDDGVLIAPSFLFGDDTNAMRVNYTRLDENKVVLFIEKMQKITEILRRK